MNRDITTIIIFFIVFITIIIYNWDWIINPYHNYEKVETIAEVLNCSGTCYYTSK